MQIELLKTEALKVKSLQRYKVPSVCWPPPTITALYIHGCGQIKEDRTVKSLHAETRPPEMFGMYSRQYM